MVRRLPRPSLLFVSCVLLFPMSSLLSVSGCVCLFYGFLLILPVFLIVAQLIIINPAALTPVLDPLTARSFLYLSCFVVFLRLLPNPVNAPCMYLVCALFVLNCPDLSYHLPLSGNDSLLLQLQPGSNPWSRFFHFCCNLCIDYHVRWICIQRC